MHERIWSVVMGAAVLLYGVAALLDNLGFWEVNIGQLWPVFLIAAGVAMIAGRFWGCADDASG